MDPNSPAFSTRHPAAADKGRQLFESLKPTLPLLIDNLSVTAKTLAVYHANLNQIVVIYPRLIAGLISAMNTEDSDKGRQRGLRGVVPGSAAVHGRVLSAGKRRSPGDQTVKGPPVRNAVPGGPRQSARRARRRNYPCVEYPGRRAPTPAECRTGYKPLDKKSLPLPNGVPGLVPKPASNSGVQGRLVPANQSSVDTTPSVYATNYDPRSCEYTGPDGKVYRVDTASSKGRSPRSGSS